ncbi:MAG: hypothetical protein PHY87_10325, partial [Sphaerochaeta sp.]|nr:hypothetical protein [Sphaerochaeta sp.]
GIQQDNHLLGDGMTEQRMCFQRIPSYRVSVQDKRGEGQGKVCVMVFVNRHFTFLPVSGRMHLFFRDIAKIAQG